jgi:hypothetical protein
MPVHAHGRVMRFNQRVRPEVLRLIARSYRATTQTAVRVRTRVDRPMYARTACVSSRVRRRRSSAIRARRRPTPVRSTPARRRPDRSTGTRTRRPGTGGRLIAPIWRRRTRTAARAGTYAPPDYHTCGVKTDDTIVCCPSTRRPSSGKALSPSHAARTGVEVADRAKRGPR